MSSLDLLERILLAAALFSAGRAASAEEGKALEKALIAQHHYLLALLRYKTDDETLAEDTLQETYLAFLAAGPDPRRFADEKKLKNYLVTIALNKLRDHWRREGGARPRRALFRSAEEAEAWLENLPSEQPDPAGSLLDSEADLRLRRCVALAMENIGDRQRLVLDLKFTKDLDNAMIAAELGLGVKAVESLLFRAKAQFKKEFEKVASDANEATSDGVNNPRDAAHGSQKND